MAVTHTTVTVGADDPASEINKDEWNASHTVADGSFVAAKLSATATDKVFGRSTAGAGNGEEIPLTAAGRALIDDATAADQRTTLGIAGAITGTKLDDLTAPDDNTDLNATTGAHGLLKKLSNVATEFMNGVGNWAVPGTFVGCRITEATAQSLADNTLTALTSNDAELYDTDGFHDTSTNTTRLTVPAGKAGYYAIGGWIFFAGNATGYREIQLRLNGATILAYNRMLNNTATGLGITTETQYLLAAGDYVEVCALQNSGGALNAFMSGFWIGRMGV